MHKILIALVLATDLYWSVSTLLSTLSGANMWKIPHSFLLCRNCSIAKVETPGPIQFVQDLVRITLLSKLDYGNTVFYPLTNVDLKRLQKCQNATRSSVLWKYPVKDQENLEKIGWFPLKERRDLHLLQQTFTAIHFANWPQYLSSE